MRLWSAFLVLTILAVAAPADNAPADRYFGRLGMSALRIRYETAQLKSRYANHKLLPENVMHLADLTGDAYYQWAARYPRDSWLASTGINLAHLYEDLPGAAARGAAVRLLSFVLAHFKSTRYSKEAASEMQRGVALKPDPLWAIKMRATPSPRPSASRGATALPSSTPSPSPAPTR